METSCAVHLIRLDPPRRPFHIPSAWQCSLQQRFRKRPHTSLNPLSVVSGYGPSWTTIPSGCSFLLFFLPGHLVHPQSLLSPHPQTTDGNKKQNPFPPCTGSYISRARFVHFRCTGSIPEVHRGSNSMVSGSRHSTSFSI